MTQCPKCQAALKEDYGMVTCPSCGAILFVDMDGIAQMGQEEASSPPESDPTSTDQLSEQSSDPSDAEPVAESQFPFDPPAFDPIAFDDPVVDVAVEAEVDALVDEPASAQIAPPPMDFASIESVSPMMDSTADGSVDGATNEATNAPSGEADFSMDSFLGFGDPAAGGTGSDATESVAPELQPLSPDDPLGLNEFANSEISQAKDGFLMFRVHIAGIDSKEIRESIREAIVDQRFAWDAARIMSTIAKGVLKIDRLSPIKATILVSRIKRLPVQIRWEQYAITQAEAEAAGEQAGERGENDGGGDSNAGYGSEPSESY